MQQDEFLGQPVCLTISRRLLASLYTFWSKHRIKQAQPGTFGRTN